MGFRYYTKWDVPRGNTEARLMKQYQKLLHVENDLEKKLGEQKTSRKLFDNQWKELEEQQQDLYQSFIEFDTYIQDTRNLQERAESQISQEVSLQKILTAKVEELTQKVGYYKSIKNEMEATLKENNIFIEYLERVVLADNSFRTIQDIFDLLDDVAKKQNEVLKERDNLIIRSAETEINKMMVAKSEKLFELYKKLSRLQQEYDVAKARFSKWKNTVLGMKNSVESRKLELIRVQASCWNMYRRICKETGIIIKKRAEEKDNLKKQFEYIKKAMLEKKQVIKDVQHKIKERKKTQRKKK